MLEERTTVLPVRATATVLGAGLAFDVAVNGQRPGVSIPLLVALLALLLRPALGGGRGAAHTLAVAMPFAVFAALRATEVLIAADILTVLGAFSLAAARDERGTLRATVESLLRRAVHMLLAALHVPAALLGGLARGLGRFPLGRARAALRATAVAVPVLAVFAALLASADRVFGELLIPGLPELDLGGAGLHVVLILAGAAGAAALLVASARSVAPGMPEVRPLLPRVGFGELATVLAGVDLLFGLFVAVQFAFLFGGQRHVEVTPGLTYAEYARSGFFQLIAVAALTVLVILGAWDMGRRTADRHERWFRVLVSVMVGLTGVILASAMTRLLLYEDAFGFTLNRLAASVGIVFTGVVLVVLVVTIWTGARERLVPAFLAAALAALLAVNLINPERFVAGRNAERFARTGAIDAAYVGTALGAEAVPVLVELLPRLAPADRRVVRASLCRQALRLDGEPGWRSANLGRARAAAALARAAITPASCAPRRSRA